MKPLFKNIIILVLLLIFILLSGLIVTLRFEPGFGFREFTVLSLSFATLSLITILVFFRGQRKDQEGQTMHLLVALGIKFIIELVIALVWFILAKKTGLASLLLFFVLYLAFTLFSVLVVLKTLKYKAL